MDLTDVKQIVREMLWEYQQDTIDEKNCPNCKASCTMIRVSVLPLENEEGYSNQWRCLNCLKLFTEELKEVG